MLVIFYFLVGIFVGRTTAFLSALLPFAVRMLKCTWGLHDLLVDTDSHLSRGSHTPSSHPAFLEASRWVRGSVLRRGNLQEEPKQPWEAKNRLRSAHRGANAFTT